ncbi:MAG: autotransporter domain-containing protein [Opitutaceae bacterium]|jgi:outer membrane autotransporter protein
MNFKYSLHLPPLAALAALLFAAPSLSAQSILGSSSNFTVLSGATVTSALVTPGVVVSNGDVGAPSLPAITGFPPATIINGTKIGGVAPAITDLVNARTILSGMAVTTDFTATPTLGGRTLTPGVYKFGVAADLTGTLILDAGGKNNVTWVINIGSSLTTAANAKVVFINLGSNGGKDNGLFWNAGVSITFGADNVIAGNYLAGAHIDFGTTVPANGSGSGRALAVTDYIHFDGAATMDKLGTGGDLTGGLDISGNLSGYVLLSSDGAYTQGVSSVILTPGTLYNTTGITVDGGSADALLVPATLTVFGTVATLTGTNTYTGGTIVDGAQVASPGLASSLTTGSANLPTNGNVSLIDSNGTGTFGALIFDQASNGSYGGVISGGGTVTKQNTGTLTVTGVNTYTGATLIGAGTVQLSGAGGINGSSGITINGATAKLIQTSTLASTPAITLTQGTLDGTGTVGDVTVGDGTGGIVTNGNGGRNTLTLASLTFDGAGTINLNKFNDTGTVALAITGALTTSNLGTGQVSLNLTKVPLWANGNTYNLISYGSFTGNTLDFTVGSISGISTRQSATFGDTGAGAGFITLAIAGDAPVWTGNFSTEASTNVISGAKNWNLITAGTPTDFLSLDNVLFDDTATTTTVAFNDATFTPSTTVFDNSAKDYTLTGTDGIRTGSLTKNGTGTLTMNNVNTYTGGTFVNGGTVIGNTDSLQGDITNNAAVEFDQAATGTYAGVMDGTGSLTKSGIGALTLSGANTYSGGTTVSAGSLIGNTTSLQGDITNNAAVTFAQASAGTYSGVMDGSGSLTKSGAGDLTLSGANTYSGGTTVSAGSLIGDTTSLQGDITNNAAVTFNQPVAGTYSGVMDGSGSLTKSGAGALTLSGLNTYTGGTTISAGSLSLSGTGTLGNSTGALAVNGGTLDLGTTSQTVGAVTLAGGTISNGTLTGTSYTSTGGSVDANLAGSGVVFTNTSGTTTLTGVNTYTGGTVINGGTVSASAATMPDSGGVILAVGGILILDDASAVTYADTITGGGTLQKTGAGALTLANTTDSLIDLQAGSMYLGSELTTTDVGATTVASGGLLGGNGTIAGNLINNGTVSPGFSPGTIFVAGNYTQGPGGTLVMEFASAASFDKLVITGTAGLAGTLQIDLLGGYDPAGQSFQILTAGGGVSGTFSAVTGSAALTGTVTYNANDVTVSFTQVPFVTFALTPNQIAVATAAQLDPAITAALNAVPLAADMPAALNALSPQGYEVWSDIAFTHATSLTDRLSRNDDTVPGHVNLYFEAGQLRGATKGDLDVGTTKYDTNGGLVGGNYAIGPNLTLGGFFEYTETSSGLGSAGSETTIKDKMFGFRAAWHKDRWFAHAVLATGFEQYESTRSIAFPGTAAVASSKTRGHTWIADLSGGRNFSFGPLTVSPFAGVLATRWDANGFNETGAGAFNNSVGSQTAKSLRTQLGVSSSLDLKLGAMMLRPHVRAAWLHELGDDQRTMDSAFGGINYAITTRKPQRDSVLLGAGFDLALSASTTLYTDVTVQSGGTSRVQGQWSAGVSVGF